MFPTHGSVVAFGKLLRALSRILAVPPTSFPREWRVDTLEPIIIDFGDRTTGFLRKAVAWRPCRTPCVGVPEQAVATVLAAECPAKEFGIGDPTTRERVLRHGRHAIKVHARVRAWIHAVGFGAARNTVITRWRDGCLVLNHTLINSGSLVNKHDMTCVVYHGSKIMFRLQSPEKKPARCITAFHHVVRGLDYFMLEKHFDRFGVGHLFDGHEVFGCLGGG